MPAPDPSPAFTLDRLAERLASLHPAPAPARGRRAAVAAVTRFDRGRAEVLLIERAVRAGDRWSGQVSFPGGRAEEGDADLRATAIRETREEVGLDLERAGSLLGRLDPVRAIARGRLLPMTITPFVFHQREEQPLSLSEEASSCFWFPLDAAASGALDDWTTYRMGPVAVDLPCWRHEGHVVWGLTYQMIRRILEIVRG